ncbi:Rna recognition motif-containing protein, partial [Cardiosporidium cionae]
MIQRTKNITTTALKEIKPKVTIEAPVEYISFIISFHVIYLWKSITAHTFNDEEEKMRLQRTIFVGNIPLQKLKAKNLLKLLGLSQNEIESVRFRSLPVHPKFQKNRKAGVLSQQFSGTKQTHNAYIVLTNPSSLPRLLEKNGLQYEGCTLRVDVADRGNTFSTFDMKRTVFVGNLPLECSEEELRAAFDKVGDIKGVRIIRDKATSISKGFGFLLFADCSDVLKTLQLSEKIEIQGRVIRTTKALPEKKAKKADEKRRKGFTIPKKISKKSQQSSKRNKISKKSQQSSKRNKMKTKKPYA